MQTHTVLILVTVQLAHLENVGWKGYLKENTEEFHDLPLTWEEDITSIPTWLSGTYIRNGPAQISFGSPRRVMTSWLDGFAKLHSFKMSGPQVLYSGKMLEPPNYLASLEAGELVPQLTLNKFATEEEEWTWWEKLVIFYKMLKMDEFGNNNPALWRIGPDSIEDGIYMAVTDGKVATRFNISDLSTMNMEYPATYPMTLNGCAHWMREPGTDNSINFAFKKGFTGAPWLEVMRWRPEDTFQTPEVVAKFKPTKFSYMHSFSITESHVVFLFYPVKIDPKKFPASNFHAFETFDGNRTDKTDVFVVNLKNGDVKGPFSTDYAYSAHHINAYEKSEDEIVLDWCPTPFENMREYLKLENMLNPPATFDPESVTTTGGVEVTRFTINTKEGSVKSEEFPNTINSKFINNFDFPTINEEYRGKKYCITYGMAAFAYSRVAIVKKNVCDPDKDEVFYRENHYFGETHFLPTPGGKTEDDGVLLTIGFDGTKEQSYLLLMDAKSFTPINTAYLPHHIPWSAHGMYFPEANFKMPNVKVKSKMKKEEL